MEEPGRRTGWKSGLSERDPAGSGGQPPLNRASQSQVGLCNEEGHAPLLGSATQEVSGAAGDSAYRMRWPSCLIQAVWSQSKLQGETEAVIPGKRCRDSSQSAGVDTALPGGRWLDQKAFQVTLPPCDHLSQNQAC